MDPEPGPGVMSVLAHELRRPLTVIRGAASLLLESADRLPPDRAAHMLKLIDSNAALMSDLIEDILLAGQLDAGALQLSLEAVPAFHLARSGVDSVVARAPAVAIVLEPHPEQTMVRADRARAATVLRALLDNAVEVSPPGADVEVAIEESAGQVRILVRDRGPGLEPDQLEAAFGRFQRVREGGRGAGLGLYLARGLARLMGGEVGVEARPGGGSIVWFRLERDG